MRSYLKTEATFAEKTVRLDGNRVEQEDSLQVCPDLQRGRRCSHVLVILGAGLGTVM